MNETEVIADIGDCRIEGCSPKRVLADNGFTYEIICARCGELVA